MRSLSLIFSSITHWVVAKPNILLFLWIINFWLGDIDWCVKNALFITNSRNRICFTVIWIEVPLHSLRTPVVITHYRSILWPWCKIKWYVALLSINLKLFHQWAHTKTHLTSDRLWVSILLHLGESWLNPYNFLNKR